MTRVSRFAASAAAVSVLACAARETHVGGAADAGPDAAVDARLDGPRADGEVGPADAALDLGPPCLLGGTSAERPATIGCPQAAAQRIVAADDGVYWTVAGPGAIVMRAGLTNGVGAPIVFDDAGALGLVVEGDFVYYTQPASGRVMRVARGGGRPAALATALDAPKLLATDGASLYWTGGRLDGGTVTKLALAAGSAPEVLVDGLRSPFALAVSGGYVYWTDLDDGTIVRTLDHAVGPPDAGVRTASRIAEGLEGPTDLALVGAYAYAPDQAGFIRRVPLDGGALELVADARGRPAGLASDGASIYWTTSGEDGALFAAPLGANGTGRALIGGEADPGALAVTADELYWGTRRGHPGVRRLARPFSPP